MEKKDYLDNVNARLELLGVPNTLSFGSQFVSGARVLMFNHHLAQSMVLNKPEFNRIFTGEENKLMAYDINESDRKYDCEILQIIPKYEPTFLKGGVESCPEFYIIVRTIEPNNISHLDYFLVKKYMMGLNGFGFLTEQQNRHPRRVGDILYKDDPITHSPRVKGEQYCMGTNLNVAYGSFHETIEDAFVISESAAKKLEATSIRQLIIDVRQDRRPLNLYGDEFTDKLLPDIGEYVREDGVLCGFRPTHLTTCVADADPTSLRELLPFQDDAYRIPRGSRIIDLTFHSSPNKLNDCYDQAVKYINNSLRCWDGIYTTYLKYKDKFKLTDKMSELVKRSIYEMLSQNASVERISENVRKKARSADIVGANNHPVEFLQVVVTYTAPLLAENGTKLTDSSGAK